jgi:hypothetical protein
MIAYTRTVEYYGRWAECRNVTRRMARARALGLTRENGSLDSKRKDERMNVLCQIRTVKKLRATLDGQIQEHQLLTFELSRWQSTARRLSDRRHWIRAGIHWEHTEPKGHEDESWLVINKSRAYHDAPARTDSFSAI